VPALPAFLILIAAPAVVLAQSATGQISGTIQDSSGSVVSGAAVQLTNQLNKQTRELTTESSGLFIFPNLVPGDYDLRISRTGFKTFVQNGINVTANEKVDVHSLTLEVGDVTSSVVVSADIAHVATDSSDRAMTVNTTQIQDTTSRGRNYLDVLRS